VCAHGNFRNWALFTLHAHLVMQRSGITAFTEEVARNVFGPPKMPVLADSSTAEVSVR
jgi:hypothetical protein